MTATNTVILGAGIIGTSTAFYLSQSARTPAQSIHLVESSPKLFASASGYAAGFCAKDWFSPSVAPLGELSFKLHKELAEEYDGRSRWGYSRTTGTSLTKGRGAARGEDWLREGNSRADVAGQHRFEEGEGPAWLTREKGGTVEIISEDDSTAQVDPLRLSHFLLEQCRERGVHLHQPAKAISLGKDLRGELASVRIAEADGSETDIPCTRLLITAGAWTPRVFSKLFPKSSMQLPISSLAGHSLVLRSPRWTSEHEARGCHAVFATDGSGFSPEVFSRIGGEIYIAGLNDLGLPLPDLATETEIDAKSIAKLTEVAKKMLSIPGSDDVEIVRDGLCFRPVTNSGRPILSRVTDTRLGGCSTRRGPGEGGVFVAAGHGPWGISLSLGTGKVLAEMVNGVETSADVRKLAL